jgi:hypothetical protein
MSRAALIGAAVVGCGTAAVPFYGAVSPPDAGNDVTYAPPYGIAAMDAGPDVQNEDASDGAVDAQADAPKDAPDGG